MQGKVASDFYGLEYEGGLIAYVNESNGTGLIAAPYNQGYASWGGECPVAWSGGINVPGTSWDYGRGAANTDSIVKYITEPGIAAHLCDTLTLNGYNDWFLPSDYEMIEVRNNLYHNGYGDFPDASIYDNKWYWTSRADNTCWAGHIYITSTTSSLGSVARGASQCVRAVRYF